MYNRTIEESSTKPAFKNHKPTRTRSKTKTQSKGHTTPVTEILDTPSSTGGKFVFFSLPVRIFVSISLSLIISPLKECL